MMEASVKILILEDISSDLELILDRIKDTKLKFSYLWVENEEEYKKGIIKFTPDIIIADYMLPDYTGLEALHLATELCPSTPFIIVTGEVNEDVAIECRKLGAIEYVMKEHLKSIGPAINQALEQKQLKTKKDLAEKSLKENERKFRSIFETAKDAIIITNDAWDIISFNKRFLDLFEYKEEEIRGKSLNILLPQNYRPDLSSSFRNFPLTKEHHLNEKTVELDGQRRDGSFFPLELSLSHWRTNGDHFFIGIIHDITDKKRSELALIRAKEKSDEMNCLRSCFLANISHEIRTPLVGIIGFASILLEELKDKRHLEMVQDIFNGGKRLKDTLTQILEYTSVEDNKYEVMLKPLNVTEVVNDTVKLFEKEAISKNLSLKIECQDNNIIANADEKLLRIVLNNLISNAIIFTEEGGIIVNVYKSRIIGKSLANVSIKDSGRGISVKDLEIIFEPYRQVSEGFNRSYEGLGLGLTIAKRMVQLMHGEIEIESEVNEGSNFTIHLPISPGDVSEAIITSASSTGIIISRKIQKINCEEPLPKLLLVEDDKLTIILMTKYLNELFEVDVAHNGEKAINLVKQKNYSAILMDIDLGQSKNGVEIAKEIRKIDNYKETAIMAVTAYAMPQDKEKIMSNGYFNHFFSKPFDMQEIIKKIQELLNSSD